jgi:hypothetical protein
MKFRTTLLQAEKNATGIQIPDEVVASLGAGKRPPVRITINGYRYRNTVAVMGGVFMVGVSAEHRKGAGISGGDAIEVEIELDTEPRLVTVPPDFQAALDQAADAQRFFAGLSYSNQRRHVLAIEEAKTAETRQRRIDKALSQLSAGKV